MQSFQDINGLDPGEPIGASPDGLGAYLRPMGEDALAPNPVQSSVRNTLYAVHAVASLAGAGLGAYHGYKRNESVGWAIGWSLFGAVLPIIAVPVMFAQGLGKEHR